MCVQISELMKCAWVFFLLRTVVVKMVHCCRMVSTSFYWAWVLSTTKHHLLLGVVCLDFIDILMIPFHRVCLFQLWRTY